LRSLVLAGFAEQQFGRSKIPAGLLFVPDLEFWQLVLVRQITCFYPGAEITFRLRV